MNPRNFFAELKPRNVSKVAAAAAEKARRSPGWRAICQLWFVVPLCMMRNA
jgi:hypothetical protein